MKDYCWCFNKIPHHQNRAGSFPVSRGGVPSVVQTLQSAHVIWLTAAVAYRGQMCSVREAERSWRERFWGVKAGPVRGPECPAVKWERESYCHACCSLFMVTSANYKDVGINFHLGVRCARVCVPKISCHFHLLYELLQNFLLQSCVLFSSNLVCPHKW